MASGTTRSRRYASAADQVDAPPPPDGSDRHAELDAIARLAAELGGVSCAVLVAREADERHRPIAAYGLDDQALQAVQRVLPPLCEAAAAADGPMVISDTQGAAPAGLQEAGIGACAVLAIGGRGGPAQTVLAALSPSPRIWSPDELRLLGDVAGIAGSLLAALAARESDEQQIQLRKLEALDRFAAGIVHDFNNLLTGMRLQLRLLSETHVPHTSLSALVQCVEEGTRLTTHLLSFTRKRPIEKRRVAVDEALRAAAPVLESLAGPGIEVHFEPAASGAAVLADLGELQELLMHLVANARDAIGHAGRIRIASARARIDRIDSAHVLPALPGTYVRLEVEDSGHGVPPSLRRQIFDPFFTTRTGREATGLGLSIVYAMVRSARGGIDVRSVSGLTAFTIYLPEASGAQAIPPAVPTPVRADATHPMVLLVDDDYAVRMLLARQLSRDRVPVITASNAAEAMIVAKQPGPAVQVLVTDVNLPIVSGLKLARQLLADIPSLRVILISGNAQDVDPEALPPGALAGVLQKPFSAVELLALVQASRR